MCVLVAATLSCSDGRHAPDAAGDTSQDASPQPADGCAQVCTPNQHDCVAGTATRSCQLATDGCWRWSAAQPCLAGARCGAAGCAEITSLELAATPMDLATSAHAHLGATAVTSDGSRLDVTSLVDYRVDGVANGSVAIGRIARSVTVDYVGPAEPGRHTVDCALAGALHRASVVVTTRARRWTRIVAGARSVVADGDVAVTSPPDLAVVADSLWIAYTTRMRVAGTVPTTVRVARIDLARPADGLRESTGVEGLAERVDGVMLSARKASMAAVALSTGTTPCVALEQEARPWASNVRVRCLMGSRWDSVALPVVNLNSPIGSLRLVADGNRTDLYWVNDLLGQAVHLPVTVGSDLDWGRATPVISTHYDVDGFEGVAVAYDRRAQPFVAAVTLENLPRLATVVRRYDADGRTPDSTVLAPYLGGDTLGVPLRSFERGRFRQTGALSVASDPSRNAVVLASAWRPGPTRFPVTAADRSTVLRVIESGRSAVPTVTRVTPPGGPFRSDELVIAGEPGVAYDGLGRWIVAYGAHVRGRRTVHVARFDGVMLESLTLPVGLPEATAGAWPAVRATGRDTEELVVAFPTFTTASVTALTALDVYAGLEVWGWL